MLPLALGRTTTAAVVSSAVVLPAQGMFQSIGSGYQSLIRLYDAAEHVEDRLTGKVVLT